MIPHLLTLLFPAIFVGFVIRDGYAWLPRLQKFILKQAAARMPVERQNSYYEEALAEVEQLPPAEISRTIRAAGFFIAAGSISRDIASEASVLANMRSRIFDFALATTLAILFWPIFSIVTLLVARDGGPTLLRAVTVGKGGREFKRFTFRTIHADLARGFEEKEWAQWEPGAQIEVFTQVGNWLRKVSLDELPTLLNIVRGEMGIVGTRPLCAKMYLTLIESDRQEYCKFKPGIVSASALCAPHPYSATQIDITYMRNRTLLKDTALIGLTALALLTEPRSQRWVQECASKLVYG